MKISHKYSAAQIIWLTIPPPNLTIWHKATRNQQEVLTVLDLSCFPIASLILRLLTLSSAWCKISLIGYSTTPSSQNWGTTKLGLLLARPATAWTHPQIWPKLGSDFHSRHTADTQGSVPYNCILTLMILPREQPNQAGSVNLNNNLWPCIFIYITRNARFFRSEVDGKFLSRC